MNKFYQAVELVRQRLQNNPLVNTVIFARTEEKDLYKKKIYPLAHINPVRAPHISHQVRAYTFEVGVFDQRDINKEDTHTTFEGNDNLLDNMNLCDAILNDLTTYLLTQNNEDRIEVYSISDANPIILKDNNTLDGWIITFTLMTPNDTIAVC